MNFGESIASVMGKYATFSGRASRSEYWWFYLFVILFSWAAGIAGALTMGDHGDILSTVVSLALVLPQIAVGSRRLHDIGRSGWWQLIGLTIVGLIPLIYWAAKKGDDAENRFGPKPEK